MHFKTLPLAAAITLAAIGAAEATDLIRTVRSAGYALELYPTG